jgi:arabinofuranosyltransferase
MQQVPRHNLSKDTAPILILLALSCLYMGLRIDWSSPPSEDAAILMRYSQHLAHGDGIVWNIGEKPLDGATDFLFMAAVAALAALGCSLKFGVLFLTIAGHLLTIVFLYLAVKKLHGAGRLTAFFTAAYLLCGPAADYIGAYFGTTFFGLFVLVSWYLINRLSEKPDSPSAAIGFSVSGLVTGLIRPEGVFLVVLMLAALVYKIGLKQSKRVISTFIIIFGVLGAGYFFWRWSYFGHPLPNPFYKKGGGTLHFDSLAISLCGGTALVFPFIIPFLWAFRSADTARKAIFFSIPAVGFLCLWVFLSNEMNYHLRFQYCIVPLALLSWPSFVSIKDWSAIHVFFAARSARNKLVFFLMAALLVCAVVAGQTVINTKMLPLYHADGRYDMAKMLSEYDKRGYTLATTEAGILPLYSGWHTLDTWGLNDAWISRHGRISREYLDRFRPHVLMFHAHFSAVARPETKKGDAEWDAMVDTLAAYAAEKGYVCAASFGDSPYESHCYYVRPDFDCSGELVKRIRCFPYRWYKTGENSINYATVKY